MCVVNSLYLCLYFNGLVRSSIVKCELVDVLWDLDMKWKTDDRLWLSIRLVHDRNLARCLWPEITVGYLKANVQALFVCLSLESSFRLIIRISNKQHFRRFGSLIARQRELRADTFQVPLWEVLQEGGVILREFCSLLFFLSAANRSKRDHLD